MSADTIVGANKKLQSVHFPPLSNAPRELSLICTASNLGLLFVSGQLKHGQTENVGNINYKPRILQPISVLCPQST